MHYQENDGVAGGSRSTVRTGAREQVRPSVTRADEVVANASGENFPVALRVLPQRYRRHLTNWYFFARLTDDLGDEARTSTDDVATLRLALLDELAADVTRIYEGEATMHELFGFHELPWMLSDRRSPRPWGAEMFDSPQRKRSR